MTNEEFEEAFEKEFPELNYLLGLHKIYVNEKNHEIPFIQYAVEGILGLVDGEKDNHGFSGDKYSEETHDGGNGGNVFHAANQYTFDFLKENKDMISFWLL